LRCQGNGRKDGEDEGNEEPGSSCTGSLAHPGGARAAAAGILILVGPIRFRRSLGAVLLAVWLILQGLLPLLSISIPNGRLLLDLLAIAAGVLLLLGN